MNALDEHKPPRLDDACKLDRAAKWLTYWSQEDWDAGNILARLYGEWTPKNDGVTLLLPDFVRVVISTGVVLVNRATGESTLLLKPQTFFVGGVALDSFLRDLHMYGKALPLSLTSNLSTMRWSIETPLELDDVRLTAKQVESLLPPFETLVRDLYHGEHADLMPRFDSPPDAGTTQPTAAARSLLTKEGGGADSVEPSKPGSRWRPKTSIKSASGYRSALIQVLRAAYLAGQPLPTARDVLDAWTKNPHTDVKVMSDGVKYNNSLGHPKEANLKAIQQAIKNLLQ